MADVEQGIVGDPPNSNSTRSSSCGCFGRLLKRQFALVNSKPKTILTEVWGGIVMYLVSLYVLGAGVGWQAGICPDCLENSSAISSAGYTAAEFRSLPGAISMAAGISTLVMGLFGNMPIIVAPGISGIAMQSVSKTIGPDGAQAAVLVVGLVVLLFAVASRRIKLISSLPEDYRLGMAAGKGGIIALIALRTSSLVSISSLGFTSTVNYNVVLAVCGFILIILAQARKHITLSFVGEIVIITTVSLIIRGATGTAIVSPEQAAIVDLGTLAGAPSFANFGAENSFLVFSYVIRATVHTLIDIVATVTAIILSGVVRSSIGYDKTTFTAVLNESSKCYHIFLSIAICEVLVNPFLGVAPVTPFIQSTAGVMVGARTGLSATICGMLFLISTLFAAPIASVIPLCATVSLGGRPIVNQDFYASFVSLVMAAKHFNERNSSILNVLSQLGPCDAQLHLVGGLFDDERLSSVAMPHLIKLLGDINIDFINGGLGLNVLETVGIAAGALRIPVLSYVANAEQLSNKQMYPTVFRAVPSNAQYIQSIVRLFEHFGYKVVAIVYTFDSVGTNYYELMQAACIERNIRLRTFGFDAALRGNELEASLKQVVGLLVAEKLNVIYRAFSVLEFEIAYAKAVIAQNWLNGKFHLSQYSTSPYDFLHAASPEDAPYLKQLYNGTLAGRTNYNLDIPSYGAFVKAWRTFDVNYVNQFFPNKTTAIGQSLLLPQNFFSTIDVNGSLTFAVAYDSVIALGLASCGSSSDIIENLQRVDFEGISGRVIFNENQSRAQTAGGVYTVLFNLVYDADSQDQIAVKTVGKYADGKWTLSDGIMFSGGMMSAPHDVERDPVTVNRVPTGAIIWGYIEAVSGTVLGFISMYLPFKHWSKSPIQKAQPIHLVFMSIGSILLALSILALAVETDAGCVTFYWLFFLGYTLVLTNLCAIGIHSLISWREMQTKSSASKRLTQSALGGSIIRADIPSMITANNTAQDIPNNANVVRSSNFHGSLQISNNDLLIKKEEAGKIRGRISLAVLLAVIFAVVALLTAYTIITPLRFFYVVTQRDVDGYPLTASATCVAINSSARSFTIVLVVILGVLTILSFAVGLRVRNAPLHYLDMNMSSVAGLCVFELFFVGVPLFITVSQTALAQFLVLSSLAFLINLTVAFTMFLPKACSWKFRAWNLVPMDSRSEGSQRQADTQSKPPTEGTGEASPARGVLRADLPQYLSVAAERHDIDSKSTVECRSGQELALASRMEAKSYAISHIPEEQTFVPNSDSDRISPVLTDTILGVDFASLDLTHKKLPSFVNFETLRAAPSRPPPSSTSFGATIQPAFLGAVEALENPTTGVIAPLFHGPLTGVASSFVNVEGSTEPLAFNNLSSGSAMVSRRSEDTLPASVSENNEEEEKSSSTALQLTW